MAFVRGRERVVDVRGLPLWAYIVSHLYGNGGVFVFAVVWWLHSPSSAEASDSTPLHDVTMGLFVCRILSCHWIAIRLHCLQCTISCICIALPSFSNTCTSSKIATVARRRGIICSSSDPTSSSAHIPTPSKRVPSKSPCPHRTHTPTAMPGTYFIPRLLLAFAVPIVLSSFGPTQSHPELGTDVGPLINEKKSEHQQAEVYRAGDVQSQAGLREMQDARQVVKLRAYRSGRKVCLRRKEED